MSVRSCDAIDDLRIRDNTIVVFTSDNGPEATWPWQGSSGPWRGYYFTHMEGSLRVPFIIRWPGRVPAGRVSNEIVHEVDTFTTFAKLAGAAGAEGPPDRRRGPDRFPARQVREIQPRGLPGVRGRPAGGGQVAELEGGLLRRAARLVDPARPSSASPKAFDLITDPKEEYPATGLRSTWSAGPAMKIVSEFEQSLKKYPPIPPGTPDPFTPSVTRQ